MFISIKFERFQIFSMSIYMHKHKALIMKYKQIWIQSNKNVCKKARDQVTSIKLRKELILNKSFYRHTSFIMYIRSLFQYTHWILVLLVFYYCVFLYLFCFCAPSIPHIFIMLFSTSFLTYQTSDFTLLFDKGLYPALQGIL